jgi:hypothetical protein
MKTDEEIRAEAVRLEQLAQRWIATAWTTVPATTLAVLSESRIGSAERVHPRLLRVEIARDGDDPEFLLVEDEARSSGAGDSSESSLILTRSDSAYDVLRDGYEALEEERLAEFLTPIANRNEVEGALEEADPDLIEEIETFVEADQLLPSARIRTRADIVEFLEGRLSPSEFIAAAIERQGPRPQNREREAELLNERISAI